MIFKIFNFTMCVPQSKVHLQSLDVLFMIVAAFIQRFLALYLFYKPLKMHLKLFLTVICLALYSVSSAIITKYAYYTYDQRAKKSKCLNSWFCDGIRTCNKYGLCEGIARNVPKSIAYWYNEGLTNGKCPTKTTEANWLNRDYYCDGKRTCSAAGLCQGTARP